MHLFHDLSAAWDLGLPKTDLVVSSLRAALRKNLLNRKVSSSPAIAGFQVANLRGKLDMHFPQSRLNGLTLASLLGSVWPRSFPLPRPVMVQSSRRPLWQGKFQIQKYLAGQSGTLVDFL